MSSTTHSVQPLNGQHEREPLLQSAASSYPSSTTLVEIEDTAAPGANSRHDGFPKVHVVATDRLAHHREMVRERFSFNWWLEWTIIIFVFSITGSSTMMIVRPLLKVLGFTGSLGAGPWSFRIAYICLTLPLYSLMLLLISSLFCRRSYFENILIRMWGRFWPSRLMRRSTTRESVP
ncbi:hypothetical protein EMPS_04747 [Entomortierella parvispora]|uniref:DUF6787 domain-containing protein n=1 Tax=Entomortierella parvispora TaxID=205924 RepID=A0A9P3H935_9FUNG|nr:hypothetical protein EMPS_04747 [Entomortierella parvispora]